MKRKLLFLILLFFSSSLSAVIFESKEFSALQNHIDKKTLVVLDIDDTVMTTAGYLGNEAWVSYMFRKLVKKGFDSGDALGIVAALQFLFYTQVEMVPVESVISAAIKNLQDKNIHVIGLTSRTLAIEEKTVEQLHSISVDFSKNDLYHGKIQLGITSLALYSDGIIFCTGNDKGEILFQFLDAIDFVPKKIVFVDDKLKHVERVQRAAEKRGIPFIGMHYTKLCEKYDQACPHVFEQELHEFKANVGWAPLSCPTFHYDLM